MVHLTDMSVSLECHFFLAFCVKTVLGEAADASGSLAVAGPLGDVNVCGFDEVFVAVVFVDVAGKRLLPDTSLGVGVLLGGLGDGVKVDTPLFLVWKTRKRCY